MLLNVSIRKVSDFFNMMNFFLLFYQNNRLFFAVFVSFCLYSMKIHELFGIVGCDSCHFVNFLAERGCYVFCHTNGQCWLVAFASVGHWCKVWRVGFENYMLKPKMVHY